MSGITPPVSSVRSIDELLEAMVSLGASDLHITAGTPPAVRVRGELRRAAALLAGAEPFLRRIEADLAAAGMHPPRQEPGRRGPRSPLERRWRSPRVLDSS